jgi:hypothetical protein
MIRIPNCKECDKWCEYNEGEGDYSDIKPDNCSTWLCNDGGCPLDRLLFIRNTHDEHGNFKWCNEFLYVDSELGIKGLGVHALNRSGKPTTYLEYVSEHHKYYDSFSEDDEPHELELIEDLRKLVNIGLVLVEEI